MELNLYPIELLPQASCLLPFNQGKDNGLIIGYRVGKHRAPLIQEIIINTEIKTEGKNWLTDGKDSPQKSGGLILIFYWPEEHLYLEALLIFIGKRSGWGGYERVLSDQINHLIGQENPQKLEPTNGIIRQETGDKRLSKSGSLHRAIGT